VATNFGELLWYLPGVLVPLIFSRSANSNGTDHIERLLRIVRLGFPTNCLLAVLFGAGGFFLIPVFYSIKFHPSSYSLLLLLPGLTVMTLFKILNADLAGQGDPLLALYSMVPGVLLNVTLNFLLIPPYGAYGAAISSTVSYVLSSFLFLIGYIKKRNIPFNNIFTYRYEDVIWAKSRISVWVGKFKA
jgi:O-antigen/teichoic acid export membrane protein